MKVVCVEMYDGRPFCRGDDHYIGVNQRDWHESAGAVDAATCLRCLDRIAHMGALAASAADRLRDAPSASSYRTQDKWREADRRRRNEQRQASGDTTLALAAFNEMLKKHYGLDPE